jgi:hypothetical protein
MEHSTFLVEASETMTKVFIGATGIKRDFLKSAGVSRTFQNSAVSCDS